MGPDNRRMWRRRGEYEDGIFAEADKYPRISIHFEQRLGSIFNLAFQFLKKQSIQMSTLRFWNRAAFFEDGRRKIGEQQWHFVQDGASCHTSASNMDALFEVCNAFTQWPPNLPCLNPIECLWGAIKKRLNWGEIATREEPIRIIERGWSEFEQTSIDSVVGSLANRVIMLKDAQGRMIQPLISAGKTIVRPGDASAMRTPITCDNDELLIELVERYGRRQKLISQQLNGFT
jgi:hypothetical protein